MDKQSLVSNTSEVEDEAWAANSTSKNVKGTVKFFHNGNFCDFTTKI